MRYQIRRSLSLSCLATTVLLAVLWIRSYSYRDCIHVVCLDHKISVETASGAFAVFHESSATQSQFSVRREVREPIRYASTKQSPLTLFRAHRFSAVGVFVIIFPQWTMVLALLFLSATPYARVRRRVQPRGYDIGTGGE
jgi:hypothetical protein